MDKHLIAIVVSVLLLFGLVISITGLIGKYLGKEAEMIMLGVIALALLVFLIVDKNKKE